MKELLVLDMNEKSCEECIARDSDDDPGYYYEYYCMASDGELLPDNCLEECPEWCPLIECPEKMSVDADDELDHMSPEEKMVSKRVVKNSEHFCNGWNACLDAIIGTED